MQANSAALRRAFGSFMTGVTVVTARPDGEEPVGFTANSFTSVSLQPPLLLVCPSKVLSSYSVFERCEHFAVTVLAEDQRAIASRFAGASKDRFDDIDWFPDAAGCPNLKGAAATFSLRTHKRVEAGDHLVLIGEVESFDCTGKAGLGYSSEGYFSLGLERRAVDIPRSSQVTVGAVVSFGDQVLLQRSGDQWHPPQIATAERRGSLAAIRGHLADAGIEANFGPVYSVFDQQSDDAVFTYYRASVDSAPPAGFGELVPVNTLDSLDYTSTEVGDMMRRYAVEYPLGVFRVYVGDESKTDKGQSGEDAE